MAKNYIDKDGLHTQNVDEIVKDLTEEYKRIYGQDINVDSDTPDGQRINIEAQEKANVLNLAKEVYNSFDVDSVRGSAQDRLYKINNIFRKSSKYTYVQVNVRTSKITHLNGLENGVDSAYTVSDGIGTLFVLVDSVDLGVGTTLLNFRAKEEGAIEVLPNTITNMITIIAGVEYVTNPTIQYIRGTDEEKDSDFNIRRNQSTAISGKGFYDNIKGGLLSIPLVTAVEVYENDGDKKEIPQESSTSAIWCIVEGGLNEDIARVIYANKTLGCKQVGNTSVNIEKKDGSIFTAKFDRPQAENLYLKMTIKSKITTPPDVDFIKSELVKNMTFDIYQGVDISEVTAKVIEIDSNVFVTSLQVSSNNLSWLNEVKPTAKNKFFVLSEENINIEVAE